MEDAVYYIIEKNVSLIRNLMENKKLLRELRPTHEIAYFNLISLSWIESILIAKDLGYSIYVHSHLGAFVADDKIHHFVHAMSCGWFDALFLAQSV